MRRAFGLATCGGAAALALALLFAPLAARAAAEVRLEVKIERKPVVLFKGDPRPAYELIREIAKFAGSRKWHTTIVTDFPASLQYSVSAAPESEGSYTIDSSSLSLVKSGTLRSRLIVQYPRLSDAQYQALKATQDYRLVYGFIRAIVEHEEAHVREHLRYLKTVRAIFKEPPLGENPVVEVTEGKTVSATLSSYVERRRREAVAKARAALQEAHRRIDDPAKVVSVIFQFRDPVEETVPPEFTTNIRGLFQARFTVPPKNPRPPEPRTAY